MHKRLRWAGVLCSLLLIFGAVPVWAEEAPDAEASAVEEAPEVYVDGQLAEALIVTKVEGTDYVSLGIAAAYLREDSSSAWNAAGQLVISAENLTLTARPGDCYIGANERYMYLPHSVRQDAYGDVQVPLKAVVWAFDAAMASGENGELQITRGSGAIRHGNDYYDPEAVDLLARVIYHECGRGSMLGRIAVGNVIFNRVAHPLFPDSLEEVIYQPGQFTNATEYEPDAASVIAAKLCIEGASVVGNACWFSQAGVSTWASRNKTQVTVLGGNAYYA